MKIIVTGSKGFIGSKLVPALINKVHEIIELDLSDGFDITDWDQVKDISDFDAIIHLAAISYVPKSYEIPRVMYRVNIIGTLNMLELCRINKAKMIFTSSYVYGKPKYLPIDEKHPTVAFNPYCESKLIGENLCESYHNDFGVPIIIFRPFNIYGAGQNDNFLIPLILKQIHEQGKVHLKDSRPKRDYIHVDDVINAYCKAVEYNKTDFDIFNIGYGISYSVENIVDLILRSSKNKVKIEYTNESRPNEVLNTVADLNKVKKKLGWEPLISIEEGLIRIMTY